MIIVVPSIVGSVYEKNSIVNSVRVDDWTAEWAVIPSNGIMLFFGKYRISQENKYAENEKENTVQLVNFCFLFVDNSTKNVRIYLQ